VDGLGVLGVLLLLLLPHDATASADRITMINRTDMGFELLAVRNRQECCRTLMAPISPELTRGARGRFRSLHGTFDRCNR
jgi:hypothetical protein